MSDGNPAPGTQLAIMEGLFRFAEAECGHKPASSRHALTTVREWVGAAKGELAALRAENAALKADIAQRKASFDLRWKADMRAIAAWRLAGEGRELE